jgi:hypothetical protein
MLGWSFAGDQEISLLVVASHGTPLPYLAYLRRERIPYLLALVHGEGDVADRHGVPLPLMQVPHLDHR